jgi:hypothetical protein
MPLLLFYSLIYQIQEGETDRRSCGLRFKALIFGHEHRLCYCIFKCGVRLFIMGFTFFFVQVLSYRPLDDFRL